MRLEDILEAIAPIDQFVAGMDFDAYANALKTKSAVERQLQIITEAAHRLGDEADIVRPGPDWKGFMGMGNILRHAYHRVDDSNIWNTVEAELPALHHAISRALTAN